MKRKSLTRIWSMLLIGVITLSLAAPAAQAAVKEEDVIYLETAEDLLELADQCRLDTWSQGKTVYLKADISLDGIDFRPIPSFGGTFEGNGHTISGLSLTGSITPAGVFGSIQASGVVKNLNVSGSVTPSGSKQTIGGIAGENYGTIRNCAFTGSISGETDVGGIAGINASTGTILRCGVEGSVKGGKRTGGIAGSNLGMIRDCTNESYINTTSADKALTPDDIEINLVLDISALNSTDTKTAATDTGGIAGYSSGIIGRCRNTGGVGYPHVGYNVGGITGRSCGYIYDSRNSGIICGRKDIGSICGQMEPYIAANMTETTLAKLQRQLDELDGLLDQAAATAAAAAASPSTPPASP